MKHVKNILGVLILLVLIVPFFIKADDTWDPNGGAGEVGSGSKNPCDNFNDFCLYNAKGGSKGVRVSLAYCTSSGCQLVTDISTNGTNKSIKTMDYWYKILSGNYRYYGTTKTSTAIKSINRNNPNYNYTSSYGNKKTDSSFFLFNTSSDKFFGDLEALLSFDKARDEAIDLLLTDLGTNKEELKNAALKKCPSCSFKDSSSEGYRIMLEPIFWWKTEKSANNWLLTPSEVASLTASKNNMSGNTDYRLYTSGVSLHTTRDDVYYKKWNGSDNLSSSDFGSNNTSFRSDFKSINPSYGIALNIINPLYNIKPKLSCSAVNQSNYGFKNASCSDLLDPGKFNNIKIDGYLVDKKWYYNECTCCGMTDVFNQLVANDKNNYTGTISSLNNVFGTTNWYKAIQFSDVKTNRLNVLFSYGLFTTYNEQMSKYADSVNSEWTPINYEKYMRVGCSNRQQDNYWCKELQTWYKQTIDNNRLPYKPITSLTKDEIIGPKYWEVTNMLQAYNIVYNQANGFFWSVNTEKDASTPTFSYVKRCIDSPPSGLSCASIEAFYGQSLSKNSCSYINNFKFTAYNIANGTNINSIWFQNNCGCNNTTATNCTPKYNIGTCSNGIDMYYKDSSNGTINDKYWNDCVFNDNGSYDINTHKTSSNGTNTYYDESLSNKYCKVYCIEEVATNFNRNINVNAGGNFTWSNHQVAGSRTCKTKNIDYDVFEKDVENANKDIVNKYADWQLEIKKENAIMTHSVTKSSSSCSCIYNTSHNSCCSSEKSVYHSRTCTKYCTVPSCKIVNGKPVCTTKRVPCGTYDCSYYTYPCVTPNNTRYDLYTAKKVDFKEGTMGTNVQWGPVSWCSNESGPTSYVNSKKKLYDDAIKTGAAIVDEMQSCYQKEDWRSNLYNFNPILSVKYDSPKYNYSGELEGDVNYGNVKDDLSKCSSTTIGLIKGCSGTNCPKTNVGMKKCSTVEMSKSASASFDIPSDVYRYVIKDTNESLMATDFYKLLNSYNTANKTLNYIDIGRGNFPVAYATPDGKYGINSSNGGELSLDYKDLGHKQGNKKTMVDNILSALAPLDYGKWSCNYYVNSYLINDKDVTVIYRPIDLTNPFPDLNGKGRNTGRNWCGPDGCSSKNNVVKDIITNNRGVKENEIYNKEPMYTFILTPAVVKEIQKYNKENKYDSYIGHLGSTETFDYVCEKGTARKCISEYFTNLIQLTGATGTCTTDRKTNFDSCRK